MAKCVDIIYNQYYDLEGKDVTIGGIQTYITNLADLAVRIGFNVRIIQYLNRDECKQIHSGIMLCGFSVPVEKRNPDVLYSKVEKSRSEKDEYLTIFATDVIIPHKKVPNSIAIQHGICWDIETDTKKSLLRSFISKSISSFQIVKRIGNVDAVVCVDNNFICWYRTQLYNCMVRLIPIMNFASIVDGLKKERIDDSVKIVFARRFYSYRGTRLFAEAVKRILCEYSNVAVTFAGNGPDAIWLKNNFKDDDRVIFTQYCSDESVKFHSNFDIAVVPTIGSEGTSLSLLEAMSAKCAVICTNVGGMTNIIIDGYNGLMVTPNIDQLYSAIKYLIDNKDIRNKISERGHDTIRKSFTFEKWEKKWREVLLGRYF